MRLREIQKVIEENLPNLHGIKFEYVSGSGYKTSQYSGAFLAVINIEKLGFINDQYKRLIENDLLVNSSKSASVLMSQDRRDIYVRNINQIIYKCEACLDLIKQNLHSKKEDENSLVISMPNRELTFIEFNDIVSTLNETLRFLNILPDFTSDVNISNFDVGSKWIVVSFLADKAIKIFGKLTTIVQRGQVGIQQNRVLELYVDSLELDDKSISDFKVAAAKVNLKIYENLATNFLNEENLDSKGELLTQMTKVIENTDKLMNMGVGFEAAVTAANEVANTFPPLIEQKKLDKTQALASIKRIENQTSNKIDDSKTND